MNRADRVARRRPAGLRAVALTGLLSAVFAIDGFAILAHASSPEKAARDYLVARETGDASTMLDNSTIVDSGDAPVPALLEPAAVRAMISLTGNHHHVQQVDVDRMSQHDDVATERVTFVSDGAHEEVTLQVRRSTTTHRLGVFDQWQVVLQPVSVELDHTVWQTSMTIDGVVVPLSEGSAQRQAGADGTATPPGGSTDMASVVELLPGYHRFDMPTAGPLDASSRDVLVTDGTAVQFGSHLSDGATDAARKTIRGYFADCATKSSLRPDGCPQSPPIGDPATDIAWAINIPRPEDGVDLALNPDGTVEARGTWSMTVTYTVPSSTNLPAMRVVDTTPAGTFDLVLRWSGADFSICGQGCS